MVRTDGRTDGRTDTEGYNIIPRHTLEAGYKNKETLLVRFVLTCYVLGVLLLIHYTTADHHIELLLISDRPFQKNKLVVYIRQKLPITDRR